MLRNALRAALILSACCAPLFAAAQDAPSGAAATTATQENQYSRRLPPFFEFSRRPRLQTTVETRLVWPLFKTVRETENDSDAYAWRYDLLSADPFFLMPLFGRGGDSQGGWSADLLPAQWGRYPEPYDTRFFRFIPLFGWRADREGYGHLVFFPFFGRWNERGANPAGFVGPWLWERRRVAQGAEDARGELTKAAVIPFFAWSALPDPTVRMRGLFWTSPTGWALFPLYETASPPSLVEDGATTRRLALLGLLYSDVAGAGRMPWFERRGEREVFESVPIVERTRRLLTLAKRRRVVSPEDGRRYVLEHGLFPLYEYESVSSEEGAHRLDMLDPFGFGTRPMRNGLRQWSALLGLVNGAHKTNGDRDLRILDVWPLRSGGLFGYSREGERRELRLFAPWGFGPKIRWGAKAEAPESKAAPNAEGTE